MPPVLWRSWRYPYRYLFESNPHPMWIYDCETLHFLLVNDAAIEHYGYSRDEFLAMTIKDIRPAEDVPRLLKSTRSRVPTKGKVDVWRHRKKDGQILDVEISAHNFNFRGRAARLCLVNDITERRRSEQALHHIMEGAHCLLWQAEVEDIGEDLLYWKLQLASEQAAQRFLPLNVTPEQSYGEAWYLSRHPEDRDRIDLYGETEVRAGRSYQQEFRCQSKDGSLRWLSGKRAR